MGFPFERSLFHKKGDKLNTIVGEDLATVYRILRYIEGVGCTIEKDPSGYGWKIVVADSSEDARPWDITNWVSSTNTVTFRPGYMELYSDTYLTYVTLSSNSIVLASGDNYIYAAADFSSGIPANITLYKDSTMTGDAGPKKYYKLLWKIVNTGGVITDAVRYLDCNYEFVGWRQ